MNRRTATVFLALFLALCGFDKSAAQSAQPTTGKTHVKLPFEYVTGHLFVMLEDPRLGRLDFLVDTGWERTSISTELGSKLRTRGSFWHSNLSTIGHGPERNVQKYRTVELNLVAGGTAIFAGEAVILNTNSLTKALKHPIDGVLGWDFFERWCVRLDYAGRQMTLTDASQCSPPSTPHAVLRGAWSRHGLLLPLVVTFQDASTINAQVQLDTGDDSSVLLNPRFRQAAGLRSDKGLHEAQPGFGINGSFASDLVPTKKVEVGGALNFTDGKILVGRPGSFSKTHWRRDGVGESKLTHDGDIGNAILEHAIITFDPVHRCLYIEPIPPPQPEAEQPK